jgi:hypothetical protein
MTRLKPFAQKNRQAAQREAAKHQSEIDDVTHVSFPSKRGLARLTLKAPECLADSDIKSA